MVRTLAGCEADRLCTLRPAGRPVAVAEVGYPDFSMKVLFRPELHRFVNKIRGFKTNREKENARALRAGERRWEQRLREIRGEAPLEEEEDEGPDLLAEEVRTQRGARAAEPS